jgi:hypothetical protein
MSRCAQTDAVLEAAFGAGVSPAHAAHAAGCTTCAMALAEARRFEVELHEIGSVIAPEPMPAPQEVLMGTVGSERRSLGMRSRLAAGVAVTAVLAGAFFLVGQWLGDAVGPLVDRGTGTASTIDIAEAAELAGIPRRGMLETEGGAIGVRADGINLELVLVRETADGLDEHVLASAGRNEIHAIRCGEVGIVWGHRPGVDRIEGPGSFAAWDRQYAVFVFSGSPDEAVSVQFIAHGSNAEALSFVPNDLSAEICSLPDDAP